MMPFEPEPAPARRPHQQSETAMSLQARTLRPDEYFIDQEPYYEPVADEIEIFQSAYRNRLPGLSRQRPIQSKKTGMCWLNSRLRTGRLLKTPVVGLSQAYRR